MRRTTMLPAALVAACLLLAGCTGQPAARPTTSPATSEDRGIGGTEPTRTPEVLPTPDGIGGGDSAAPTPTDGDVPLPTGEGGGDAVDPGAYTTVDGTATQLDFDSPDHNVHCGIRDTQDSNSFYGCVIEHRTYAEPPRGDCQQAFGKGFVAAFAGRPHAACRGDVLFAGETASVPVLPSGARLEYGAITCSVAGDAVTCGNERGDGFTLSASRYALRG